MLLLPLLLLFDAGFSCCVLFFLLLVLLLPLFAVCCCLCCFCCCCFLLLQLSLLQLRALSSRRPLKSQSLPAFWPSKNVSCSLFCCLCCCVAAVWYYLCFSLYNLLLHVRLVVCAVPVVVAAFFSACTVLLFLLFVLLLLPLLGRRPLKNTPLPLLTFHNVQNNVAINDSPLLAKMNSQLF